MYFYKFIRKLSKQLKKNSFVILINHTFADSKLLLTDEFKDYNFVSLKQKSALELLKKDPYKFFNIHHEKVIFTHIELVPDFISLLVKYSMSVYRLENYILVSEVDLKVANKSGVKMRILPFREEETNRQFDLSEQIFNSHFQKELSERTKKIKQQILSYFKNHSSIHQPEKISTLIHLLVFNIDQQLNLNQLAKNLHVSQPTVQKWIELLEKLGVIYLLQPYPTDFGKRIIKASKLYFCDLNFACNLLKIQNNENLVLSPHFFSLVHNFYVMELIKNHELEGHSKKCYYWKESNGHEIKFLIQNPTSVDIFEFTSSHEAVKNDLKELDYFDFLTEGLVLSKTVIYDGYQESIKNGVKLLPWKKIL